MVGLRILIISNQGLLLLLLTEDAYFDVDFAQDTTPFLLKHIKNVQLKI